jgi:predicted RNA-binding Zn-ribbon protein involved in translation (DUF1610 family)
MSDDHVKEEDLDFSPFHCCGDEDLYPFRCSSCGRPMVFCYECDTLYPDLRSFTPYDGEMNHSDSSRPIFACPQCGHQFEYYFMRSAAYHVSFEDWRRAGLGHLLKESR